MRLIHIVPAISEAASGPSYTVTRLCEALVDRGHDLTLACLQWGPPRAMPPFVKSFALGRGPKRLGASPAMRHWLASQCESRAVDVLHNHGMWQLNAVYPAWAARRGHAELVYSPRGAFSAWAMAHGSWAKKLFWPLLQAPAIRRATCIHATADSEYEEIRKLGFRQPISVIPNGIDVPVISTLTKQPTRTLLFLSRVHRKKGLEFLLHAWQRVQGRFPEWRLAIAGGDEGYRGSDGYADDLRRLAASLQLGRVEFLGPRYGQDKVDLMAHAELFVLPTFSENFGVVVAEALAAGTPAIVSKGAPWPGIETHGAGWWIDIGVDPLANCLASALAMPPTKLAEMGGRGRDWMAREFSWDFIGSQMEATYRWLSDRARPAPACVRVD